MFTVVMPGLGMIPWGIGFSPLDPRGIEISTSQFPRVQNLKNLTWINHRHDHQIAIHHLSHFSLGTQKISFESTIKLQYTIIAPRAQQFKDHKMFTVELPRLGMIPWGIGFSPLRRSQGIEISTSQFLRVPNLKNLTWINHRRDHQIAIHRLSHFSLGTQKISFESTIK